MPYIRKEFRTSALIEPVGSGELDYKITMLILDYLKKTGWNFDTMNSIVGVLDNVKVEFQRRIMFPYEDGKIFVNGDVYPPYKERVDSPNK